MERIRAFVDGEPTPEMIANRDRCVAASMQRAWEWRKSDEAFAIHAKTQYELGYDQAVIDMINVDIAKDSTHA